MGIFCENFEATENRTKYYVLKSKPMSSIAFACIALILFIHVYVLNSYKDYFRGYWFHIAWFLLGLFALLVIIRQYEYRKAILPWFFKRKIIKKGSNNFSFSSPAELWIERIKNQ